MNNLDETRKELSKAIEDIARSDRALASSQVMADLARSIQVPNHFWGLENLSKAFESSMKLSSLSDFAKAIPQPEHLTAFSKIVAEHQKEYQRLAESFRPPQYIDEMSKQMCALRESITVPFQQYHEMIQKQSKIYEDLAASFATIDKAQFGISQISQSMSVWNIASIGLANRMSDIGLLAQRERLSERLLEPSIAYTEFVRNTTKSLAKNPLPDIAARLRGSLNLAERQMLEITDAVTGFIMVPEDNENPDRRRVLNAPITQQNELLNYREVGDENDTAKLTTFSLTAQTVNKARRVLELVTQCNEAGKTSTFSVEFFKPTTRLMTVFSDLPWLSATDRLRFGDIVDCLYFIFYEGAGKDNLRFLHKNGGPLSEADCDLIWCIKHLRNKWTRHDSDHGNEKEISKSWAELTSKLHWLGLAEHPTNARHFQQLHYKLLELSEEFLVGILNKLTLKD
jgi:uncharacterized protein YoxC